MEEKIDLSKYLIKLTDREDQDLDDVLPEDVWKSEDGSLYRAPGSGSTKFWSSPENPSLNFRYNWRTKEVEVFEEQETEDGRKIMHFYDSQPLSLYDYLHVMSPEYWYKIYLEDLLKI